MATPARVPAELTDEELLELSEAVWRADADKAVQGPMRDVEIAALRAVADAAVARFADAVMAPLDTPPVTH